MIDAYIDGELDTTRAGELESHIATCGQCATGVQDRRALRSAVRQGGLYRPAPQSVRSAVLESVRAGSPQPTRIRTPRWAWAALAACITLMGAVGWLIAQGHGAVSTDTLIMREAVSSHIRSLMASHIADVATSDQHTVKPWFAGKLDFSPRVVDHASDGFPLTGGRLDYINNRPVAAIVYQRRQHTINLFTCPDTARPKTPTHSQDRGYNAVTWTDGAMRYCAVSDVNRDDLDLFVNLVSAPPSKSPD
jgi:anti-sigma factor RsiW